MYALLHLELDDTIYSDDGFCPITRDDQMRIILTEITTWQHESAVRGPNHEIPFGIDIQLVISRTLDRQSFRREMQECVNLKIKYANLVRGKSYTNLLFYL